MNNTNQGGQSTPHNDPEKTNIHMGGAPGNPSSSSGRSDDDRTRVEAGRPSQPSQSNASAQASTNVNPTASNTIPPRPTDALNKKTSSGVSTGAAIGGAAAAGLAGVAAGTAYSEEIKAGVESVKENIENIGGVGQTDAPEEPKAEGTTPAAGTETPPATEPAAGATNVSSTTTKHDPVEHAPAAEPEAANSISGTYTDENGTIYKVEMLDKDGDGTFDKQSLDITTIDGDNLHVVSNGNDLGDLFAGLSEPATPEDYIQTGGFAINTGFGDASMPVAEDDYPLIQLSDPEDIEALGEGAEMLEEIDPYAEYEVAEVEIDPSAIVETEDEYFTTGTETDFTIPIEDTSLESSETMEAVEFDSVDWAEFDQPVESGNNEEYDNLLQETDFNSEDYNFDSGEDLTNTDYGATDFL